MTSQRGARTHIDVAAFHEAGHAVAAVREGRELGRVIVRWALPGSGVVYHTVRHHRNPYDPTVSPGTARAAWEWTLTGALSDVRICLAGPLAEAKALNQPMRALGARSDMEGCRRIAHRLESCWQGLWPFVDLPAVDIDELINRERAQVRRWLGRPTVWSTVSRLAESLARKGTLLAADVALEFAEWYRPAPQLSLCLHGEAFPPRQERRSSAAGSKGRPTHDACLDDFRSQAPMPDIRSTPPPVDSLRLWTRQEVVA